MFPKMGGAATRDRSATDEMIAEPTFAFTHGATVADFSRTIHPYPTETEALRTIGDAYRRKRLTPRVKH
jgi:pyruvate/2-oxoglutarate dehydrogenase complex dihydrolipoamide dehydrogenase (E3) component